MFKLLIFLSNKGHLLRLLCDESGLKRSNFGDIIIRKKESKVTVTNDVAAIFKSNFKGTRVKGQKVKVAQRGFDHPANKSRKFKKKR